MKWGQLIGPPVLLFLTLAMPAAARVVVGTVVNEAGRPLEYASVQAIGSNQKVFTRARGYFRLADLPDTTSALAFRMVAYRDTTVALRADTNSETLRVELHLKMSLRGNVGVAEQVVRDMKAARTVQALRIDGQGLGDHTDRPKFRSFPVLSSTEPAARQVEALCNAVMDASRDSCGPGATLCEFVPAFALRFHGTEPPLDLLVSEDCGLLMFLRGDSRIGHGSGGGDQCVAATVKRVMKEIFER